MADQTHNHAHAAARGGGEVKVGILTCSDRSARGERADASGPTVHNLVIDRLGAKVAQYKVVPDERSAIESTLVEWVDQERLDLILTNGGTGFSPRDVTPEATRAVVDREAPALVQAMLFETLRITPYAMLTRATAGIRHKTLIVNLPGSPKALTENFEAIAEVLPHAVDIVRGVDTHDQHAPGAHPGGVNVRETRAGHADDTSHAGGLDRSGRAEHGGYAQPAPPEGGQLAEAPRGASGPTQATGGLARNVGGPPC